MEKFIARYRSAVTAMLTGFDRLVFRGTLLPLVMERGMHTLLARVGVRLLDFKGYALATSESVKDASLQEAVAQRRPVRYLESAQTDKEALARRLLAEHPIDRSLICALRTVEPCMSFEPPLCGPRRARPAAATAEVPAHLQVLPPPRLRLPAHPRSGGRSRRRSRRRSSPWCARASGRCPRSAGSWT